MPPMRSPRTSTPKSQRTTQAEEPEDDEEPADDDEGPQENHHGPKGPSNNKAMAGDR